MFYHLLTVARFSFERSVYEFNEDAGDGLIIGIIFENSDVVDIEDDVSTTVIVNSNESNATQGMYTTDSKWCCYFVFSLLHR